MRIVVQYQGRVQGVGFRATTRNLARGLPVTGLVRNEPDGTVRLEVQGDEAAVQLLRSRVSEVLGRYIWSESTTPASEIPGEHGFVISR